jgi:hypothetical protein
MAPKRRFATIGLAIVLTGCGGSEATTIEDVPTEFRSAQHLLGVINREMDRVPEAPPSTLVVPENLKARFVRDSLLDPKVRSWAWRTVRAQERLNRESAPIFASLVTDELQAMRDDLAGVRADGPISDEFASLMKTYGRAAFEWVSAEGRAKAEAGDDVLILRRAIRAHERFLTDARAGGFPTDDDAEAAYSADIAPIMREIRDAQRRSLRVRADVEDAVDRLNEAQLALGDYIDENADAQGVAGLLAQDDPRGLFSYFAERGAN